jgi:hypothetical protein
MAIQNGQQINANDFVGPSATYPTIEVTTGVTHSLVTSANQRVMVWAKGNSTGSPSSSAHTFNLKYNGVTKDTVISDGGTGDLEAFALMYTETPGAGTQNITVDSDVSIGNVVIMVMKF